ncbi:glycoside hydrolase family 28 protein [Telmatobacter sp. DSM 110680]|uniref:Glycoside hydrolase family 28 protein n=1 Tax=Telmatobacter sp. DSM 110680 TaxID=3036704 RepID=A0AAU7DKU2_9BACT
MQDFRRDFLKMAGLTMAGSATTLLNPSRATSQSQPAASLATSAKPVYFDVRAYGAKGDGVSIDTPAINGAIDAASNTGGGTVIFPAGVYACYSIHLKSNVALFLQQGATILAAPTPYDGTTAGGYDSAEPQGSWEPYQDYGHNHWHNSLLWGENIHNFGIFGPGLIWGKGLSRGHDEKVLPNTTAPGVGNKAIALKNCRNVILSDFSILQGGWFGILATGVDNFTIDNLKIDTNRDGIDIDCCRNVRVSNCTVNSPWDDGICPKSSYALGYARATENLTITNCYVTGVYELGSVLDGTWKKMEMPKGRWGTGRIKLGTETNGGFKNITISNCVFESCRGFALESVDGAVVEDITFSNVTMRDVNAPFFLRLGARLRGPKPQTVVGSMKRIVLSNLVSSGAAQLPSIIAGVSDHPIEDLKISDVYLHQVGGASADMAAIQPAENADKYPEPTMFGDLPATGMYIRHAKNVELSNVEIATESADARPAFYLDDVDGADFFRVKFPQRAQSKQFRLKNVSDFRLFGCHHYADAKEDHADDKIV